MTTYQAHKQSCPTCGHEIDCATLINGSKKSPTEGDLSICTQCADILAFDQHLRLRLAELNDLMKLTPKQHFQMSQVQEMVREARAKQP
jgi:hypothetical protein